MILKSIEPGISFRVQVFPTNPAADFDFEDVADYAPVNILFFQIVGITEGVTADGDWQDSPLHEETGETIRLGAHVCLLHCQTGDCVLTGEYSVEVVIEEE